MPAGRGQPQDAPRRPASSSTPPGAHRFLTETAWLLEQAGFGVLLPAWWTRKGTKQRLTRARPRQERRRCRAAAGCRSKRSSSSTGRWPWATQVLSLKELETLARLKAPLVKVRGQWVQVNAEEIQAALDFWKQQGGGQGTVREVVQMALGAAQAPGGLAVQRRHGRRAGSPTSSDQLEGRSLVRGTAAAGRLPRRRCGPTRCAATPGSASCAAGAWAPAWPTTWGWARPSRRWPLIQRDCEAGERRPVLLICPTSVVGNWKKEAARFTPDLPVLIHHGGQRTRGDAFRKKVAQHALVLSSYALLHRDLRAASRRCDWAGVVLDEAQNIKNPETKQAQAARALAGRLPHRPDRHAGREPRRRPVVDHGVPQPRLPGHAGRVPPHVLRADPGRSTTPRRPSGSSG